MFIQEVTKIPNGETHEKLNLMFLAAAIPTAYFKGSFTSYEMTLMIVGYLIGTFFLNPDCDIASKPQNRWLVLKKIWKPFTHRGILHSAIMWAAMFGIAYYHDSIIYVIVMVLLVLALSYIRKYKVYTVFIIMLMFTGSYFLMQPLFIAGVVASALCHIGCDTVMDIWHKIT
jgi:uncharacterized metal-binding protein